MLYFSRYFVRKQTPKINRKRKIQAKNPTNRSFGILCRAELKSKFNLRKDDDK